MWQPIDCRRGSSRRRMGLCSREDEPPLSSTCDFGIHGVNQSSDIPVSERVGLETSRIVWMIRHMIGTDRTRELRVPENSHDLEKVHLALIGINLGEIVKTRSEEHTSEL